MHLKKAIKIYLEWKTLHKTSTYQPYQNRLMKFAEFIGNKPLEHITGDDIVRFHKQMKTHYSDATIDYSARILKSFFRFYKGRNLTTLNPDEIESVKFINPDKEIVTKEDFEDMDDLLDKRYRDDLVKKLVINMLWDTGVRVSELLDIALGAIEKNDVDGLRYAKVRTRKSMRYNFVVWSKRTDELLKDYLAMRLCLEDVQSDKLLINPKTKKPYTPKTIQRWIKELSQMAILNKSITPHSFRHGKAHYILDQGGSVRDVAVMLRHVNPQSSFNYLQLSPTRYLETAGKYLTTA